jgi:hypothetical protein
MKILEQLNLPVIATHAVIEEGSETPGLSK